MLEIILFTNRNLLVFDEEGKQHPLQEAVDCYMIDEILVKHLLQRPAHYYLSKWGGEWKHEITKKERPAEVGERRWVASN